MIQFLNAFYADSFLTNIKPHSIFIKVWKVKVKFNSRLTFLVESSNLVSKKFKQITRCVFEHFHVRMKWLSHKVQRQVSEQSTEARSGEFLNKPEVSLISASLEYLHHPFFFNASLSWKIMFHLLTKNIATTVETNTYLNVDTFRKPVLFLN